MIRGTTAERKPKAPASQEAGVFALSGLQAVITVIGALAGYVAPRSISPVGKPEARVARVKTGTLQPASIRVIAAAMLVLHAVTFG